MIKAVKNYDVVIIGAGPAGIFTALELADKGYTILMVEKGQESATASLRASIRRPWPRIRCAMSSAAGAVPVRSVMAN